MAEAWIIDACRTPRGIGKVGKGALADIHPQRLGATVLRRDRRAQRPRHRATSTTSSGAAACRSGTQGGDLGRMSALDAGYAITASGVTLDRFCGSGITATNLAAASVMAGLEDVVVAGGAEMMSSYTAERRARTGRRSWTAATCTCASSTPRPTRAWPPTPSPASRASPATPSTSCPPSRSAGPAVAIEEGRFEQQPRARPPGRRHGGARPRGVPAPGHHGGVARRAGPVVRGHRRLPARRGRAPPTATWCCADTPT